MADTSVLDPFSTPKETTRVAPQQIGGSMELPPDLGFEVKTPLNNISSGVGEILQGVFSLGQEVAGAGKFSSGSIEFSTRNQAQDPELLKKEQLASSQKVFFEAMGAEQTRVARAHNLFVVEEEIRALSETMSEEEGNELMHLQKNYAREHTQNAHGIWNKRLALMDRLHQKEKQQKEVSVAQTQPKGKTAMQGIFEGSSGTQGGGMANLSATGSAG